jgi:hypothetical protein
MVPAIQWHFGEQVSVQWQIRHVVVPRVYAKRAYSEIALFTPMQKRIARFFWSTVHAHCDGNMSQRLLMSRYSLVLSLMPMFETENSRKAMLCSVYERRRVTKVC